MNHIENVLSLFDGMSCGQIALERAGITYNNYYASEIDKHAIKVTQHNYPNTIQLGDITKLNGKDLPKIDLLIGGSPCQGFSFAGKQLNFNDPRSRLFFEYVRLKEECNPRYFLLENVKMKKEYQDVITRYLGVEPILINSSLVSAQNRNRLYWTNIPDVEQPEDSKIFIKDILLLNTQNSKERHIEPSMLKAIENNKCKIIGLNEKSNTCTTKQRRWNNSGFVEDNGLRYFSPGECELLQTLPLGYTSHINSDTQRYKMIGNGWTVDVVAHIFKNLHNIL